MLISENLDYYDKDFFSRAFVNRYQQPFSTTYQSQQSSSSNYNLRLHRVLEKCSVYMCELRKISMTCQLSRSDVLECYQKILIRGRMKETNYLSRLS